MNMAKKKINCLPDRTLIMISLDHSQMNFVRLLPSIKESTQKCDIKRPYGINWQKFTSHSSGNTTVIKQWHAKRMGVQAEGLQADLLMKAGIFTGDLTHKLARRAGWASHQNTQPLAILESVCYRLHDSRRKSLETLRLNSKMSGRDTGHHFARTSWNIEVEVMFGIRTALAAILMDVWTMCIGSSWINWRMSPTTCLKY